MRSRLIAVRSPPSVPKVEIRPSLCQEFTTDSVRVPLERGDKCPARLGRVLALAIRCCSRAPLCLSTVLGIQLYTSNSHVLEASGPSSPPSFVIRQFPLNLNAVCRPVRCLRSRLSSVVRLRLLPPKGTPKVVSKTRNGMFYSSRRRRGRSGACPL